MGGTQSKGSTDIYEFKVGSTIHFEIQWLHRILSYYRVVWKKDGTTVGFGIYSKDNALVTDSGSYVGYVDGNPKYEYKVLIYENLFESEFLGIRTSVTKDEKCEEEQGISKSWFSTGQNPKKEQLFDDNYEEKGLQNYNMTNKPRGIAVIIAIDKFKTKEMNIEGMKQNDTAKCRKTFEQLHFEIKECTATKADGIIKYLKNVANDDYSKYDCFALYISTHGGHGYICGSDFESNDGNGIQKGSITLSELLELFLPDNCKSLINKPKLFFFDSCRTGLTGSTQSPIRVFDSKKERAIHYSDILIGYATIVGNTTKGSGQYGSYYTNVLTKCLQENAPTESFADVMVEVNHRMKKYHQISHYESTLTGKIVMNNLN